MSSIQGKYGDTLFDPNWNGSFCQISPSTSMQDPEQIYSMFRNHYRQPSDQILSEIALQATTDSEFIPTASSDQVATRHVQENLSKTRVRKVTSESSHQTKKRKLIDMKASSSLGISRSSNDINYPHDPHSIAENELTGGEATQKKKAKNRESAKMFRLKQKTYYTHLEGRNKELANENFELKATLRLMKAEKERLDILYNFHFSILAQTSQTLNEALQKINLQNKV